MIVLHGLLGDTPLASVWRILRYSGRPTFFLDQQALGRSRIDLSVSSPAEGELQVGGHAVDLRSVTAAFLRPYDARQLPEVERAGPGSPLWSHAIRFEDAVLSWAEITTASVINRPTAMASNNSKPYQSRMIEAAGFETPGTLLTTDPDAVGRFVEAHDAVVYKSISGVRSIVSRLREKDRERLGNVRWCPTQFQEYVPGDDYRVHVVGDETFASRIESSADDYRYSSRRADSVVKIAAATLPHGVLERCRRLTRDGGLLVSGIDLRLTPEGKWYCFEVNTSPAFTYYQEATGQPIDQAVANLLIAA
ncbi:MAG: RimK family alpha-L-glutamate ligase [Candidatus Lutacidiplasmatales archaeon]